MWNKIQKWKRDLCTLSQEKPKKTKSCNHFKNSENWRRIYNIGITKTKEYYFEKYCFTTFSLFLSSLTLSKAALHCLFFFYFLSYIYIYIYTSLFSTITISFSFTVYIYFFKAHLPTWLNKLDSKFRDHYLNYIILCKNS